MPRIVHLEETGSTNSDAMRLALAGEALPLWVVARRQSAGRGRAGRDWVSCEGNLMASLAVLVEAPLAVAGQLSLVAGVALCDCVQRTLALAPEAGVRLKWPNDLLIGTAKAGGILVESTTARGAPGFLAVLGFGVNIASAPDGLDRPATALARHCAAQAVPTAATLLGALAEACERWLGVWDAGNGFSTVRAAWIERAGAVGEAITVNTGDGVVSGSYQGLSDDGSLIARIDGTLCVISHGDVALQPSDGAAGAR